MAVLPFRTHPIVSTALALARTWCEGHQIDGAPALAHALRVASLLGTHVPTVTPELLAAALLHDAPDFAPAAGVGDLDAVLTDRLSAEVARVVRALTDEHQELDEAGQAPPPIGDPPVLLLSAADKIVSVASVLDRADAAPDPGEFWSTRRAFFTAVPYVRAVHQAAADYLPPALADALHALVIRAELAARQHAG
jgi:hypothetical protein